jgi:hypothetical protein
MRIMSMPLPRRCARTVAAVIGAALVLLGAAPASAGVVGGGGKPSPREFVESGLPVTFPAEVACPFEVTLSEVANQVYARTFPNGNTLLTGRLVIRITNEETGESVVRNVSGPALLTTGPNGEDVFVLSGASLSPVFAGEDATGRVGTGLFVFHGPTVFTDNQLTRVSGSFENLCTTLAG